MKYQEELRKLRRARAYRVHLMQVRTALKQEA